MAKCQCSETPKYNRDLSKLNGIISTALTNAIECQGDISAALGIASDNLCEALSLGNNGKSVATNLGTAAEKMKSAENTANGDRASEANRLAGKLAELVEEDKEYHEEQAARRRSHASSTQQSASSTNTQSPAGARMVSA